jgi:hypothetical protein
VDLIGKGKHAGIYLQENKTKGDIDEISMQRQLTFDLQTMMYMVALQEELEQETLAGFPKGSLMGVRYNVVRRPLSGGKGTIKRLEPSKRNPDGETKEAFYARVSKVIEENPAHFFMRWKVEVTLEDIKKFRQTCLDPILEQLCTWWQVVNLSEERRSNPFDVTVNTDTQMHWRHPYTAFGNPLDQGMSTEYDAYLDTGNKVGLRQISNLFPELQEGGQ